MTEGRFSKVLGSGAVFENHVISEQPKRRLNALHRPEMLFYRDSSKTEADLVDVTDGANGALVCEIKSGQTYRHAFACNLTGVAETLKLEGARMNVVYGGEGAFSDGSVEVHGIAERLARRGALCRMGRAAKPSGRFAG